MSGLLPPIRYLWPPHRYEGVPSISYEEFSKKAKTGDILIFHGVGFFSVLEELVTHSQVSHVGMVYRDTPSYLDVCDSKGGNLFLWEATEKDDFMDFISWKHKDGPRVVDLPLKVFQYNSVKGGIGVIWRPLQSPLEISDKRFMDFAREIDSKTYEWSMVVLFEAWMRKKFTHPIRGEDEVAWFCSEVVVETWKRCFDVPITSRSTFYIPQDFLDKYDYALDLFTKEAVEAGFSLGPSYYVEAPVFTESVRDLLGN